MTGGGEDSVADTGGWAPGGALAAVVPRLRRYDGGGEGGGGGGSGGAQLPRGGGLEHGAVWSKVAAALLLDRCREGVRAAALLACACRGTRHAVDDARHWALLGAAEAADLSTAAGGTTLLPHQGYVLRFFGGLQRSGLLLDEPGTGKTVSVLAIIAASRGALPRVPALTDATKNEQTGEWVMTSSSRRKPRVSACNRQGAGGGSDAATMVRPAVVVAERRRLQALMLDRPPELRTLDVAKFCEWDLARLEVASLLSGCTFSAKENGHRWSAPQAAHLLNLLGIPAVAIRSSVSFGAAEGWEERERRVALFTAVWRAFSLKSASTPSAAGGVPLSAATVIIAPTQLAEQWRMQLERHAPFLEVLCVFDDHDEFLPPSAGYYDVVLTTVRRVSVEWSKSMRHGVLRRKVSALLSTRWLRLVLDEGHDLTTAQREADSVVEKLGATFTKRNIHLIAGSIDADQRLALTGTPTPSVEDAISYLPPLLDFVGFVGLRSEADIIRVLKDNTVRNRKIDIAAVPKLVTRTVCLKPTEAQRVAYNLEMELARRNMLMSDWFDPNHYESLLHFLQISGEYDVAADDATDGRVQLGASWDEGFAAQRGDGRKQREHKLSDLSDMCFVAEEGVKALPSKVSLGAGTADDEFITPIEARKRGFGTHLDVGECESMLAEMRQLLEHGGECHLCRRQRANVSLVFPPACGCCLCLDCASTSRTQCALCKTPYTMQDTTPRQENQHPQHAVPVDMIEAQASWIISQRKFIPHFVGGVDATLGDGGSGKMDEEGGEGSDADAIDQLHSCKLDWLVKQLSERGDLASKKVLIFSSVWDRLAIASEKLKRKGIRAARLVSPRGSSHANQRELAAAKEAFEDRLAGPNACFLDSANAAGWDLSFVDTIVLLDPLLDRSLLEQVVSRGHRMGSRTTKTVITLAMEGTHEETLAAAQWAKPLEGDDVHHVAGVDVKLPGSAMEARDRLGCVALLKLAELPQGPSRQALIPPSPGMDVVTPAPVRETSGGSGTALPMPTPPKKQQDARHSVLLGPPRTASSGAGAGAPASAGAPGGHTLCASLKPGRVASHAPTRAHATAPVAKAAATSEAAREVQREPLLDSPPKAPPVAAANAPHRAKPLADGYEPSKRVEDYIIEPILNLSILEEHLGADAVAGMLSRLVTPTWRVMLLSDGSVTRHLELLTGKTVHVDLVQQRCVGNDLVQSRVLDLDVQTIPGPHVQREVFLSSDKGERMAYAASWWSEEAMNTYMKEIDKPIWVNLASTRTEVYRNILAVYRGKSKALEEAFGCKGPFWGRHYICWHGGQPMTLIYEVFNPKYLGPAEAC